MRALLLITDLQRGGTPLRVARLALALRDLDAVVAVASLAPPGPVSAVLEQAGIATFSAEARGMRDCWRLRRLLGFVRTFRPDVIHAHLTHANVAARGLSRLSGVPCIGSTATIERERRWHLRIERATAWLDAAHVVNSAALREHVSSRLGVRADRVHVVPLDVAPEGPSITREDARARLGIHAERAVLCWVGRMDPVKRVPLLLDAMALLHQEKAADARPLLLLAGDGASRADLAAQASRLNLESAVRLLGWQNDITPVLAASDLLVLPSLTEGVPNAVLEAMTRGTPVLAADLPTLCELRGNPPRLALIRDPDAAGLAAEIARLMAAPQERQTLAARALEWSLTHLSTPRVAAETLAVYRAVLSRRQSR